MSRPYNICILYIMPGIKIQTWAMICKQCEPKSVYFPYYYIIHRLYHLLTSYIIYTCRHLRPNSTDPALTGTSSYAPYFSLPFKSSYSSQLVYNVLKKSQILLPPRSVFTHDLYSQPQCQVCRLLPRFRGHSA